MNFDKTFKKIEKIKNLEKQKSKYVEDLNSFE